MFYIAIIFIDVLKMNVQLLDRKIYFEVLVKRVLRQIIPFGMLFSVEKLIRFHPFKFKRGEYE